MEIAIGTGDREIVTIRQGERLGVLLRKTDSHPIGEFTGSGGQEYQPGPDDVCIWIDHLESGRILQDTVGLALLKIQKVVPLG